MSTYSVLPILKKRVSSGLAMVMLRITVDGKRAEISIKRQVDPDRWDPTVNRLRGNKGDAKEVNHLIDNLILKLNKITNNLIETDHTLTALRIKNIYLGRDLTNKSLLQVFAVHNDMMRSRIGIDYSKSTFTRYSTTYDHIMQFLKECYKLNDIMLRDIQYSFITDLQHFLKSTRNCNHNSSQKYIRNFRKIINAIKNEWLDKDPFRAYHVKLKELKAYS